MNKSVFESKTLWALVAAILLEAGLSWEKIEVPSGWHIAILFFIALMRAVKSNLTL